MTFNLRLNTAEDGEDAWPYRKEKAVHMIEEHGASVIGVQEGLFPMIDYLQKALSSYEMIGEGRGGGEIDEYSAIFYKKDVLELVEHGQFWLSETPEIVNSISWDSACPRICTWGKFGAINDSAKEFVVYNTHLDHVSQEAREKGIQLILTELKQRMGEGLPAIFMGDLNVEPDNQVIRDISHAGLIHAQTEGRTFHDFFGGVDGEPIDYIFTSKDVEVDKVEVDRRLIDGSYPSDHYPVIADLII